MAVPGGAANDATVVHTRAPGNRNCSATRSAATLWMRNNQSIPGGPLRWVDARAGRNPAKPAPPPRANGRCHAATGLIKPRGRVLPVSPASESAWREHHEQMAGRVAAVVHGVRDDRLSEQRRESGLCRNGIGTVPGGRGKSLIPAGISRLAAQAAAQLATFCGTFRVPLPASGAAGGGSGRPARRGRSRRRGRATPHGCGWRRSGCCRARSRWRGRGCGNNVPGRG